MLNSTVVQIISGLCTILAAANSSADSERQALKAVAWNKTQSFIIDAGHEYLKMSPKGAIIVQREKNVMGFVDSFIETSSGKVVFTLPFLGTVAGLEDSSNVSFSSNETEICTVDSDNQVLTVWEIFSGQKLYTQSIGSPGGFYGCRFLNGTTRFWLDRMIIDGPNAVLDTVAAQIVDVPDSNVSPDLNYYAMEVQKNTTQIFKTFSNQLVMTVLGKVDWFRGDSNFFAVTNYKGADLVASIFELSTLQLVSHFNMRDYPPVLQGAGGNADRLFSYDYGLNTVAAYSLSTGARLWEMPYHGGSVMLGYVSTFSQDGLEILEKVRMSKDPGQSRVDYVHTRDALTGQITSEFYPIADGDSILGEFRFMADKDHLLISTVNMNTGSIEEWSTWERSSF